MQCKVGVCRLRKGGRQRGRGEGRLKLNVDASVNRARSQTGLGWVLRNGVRGLVGAKVVSRVGCWSVREAEALRVREVLSWLKD